MSHGDLLTLVRNKELGAATMLDMAHQAASGMAYLHSEKILHRYLALRNLLVTKSHKRYLIKLKK